MNILIGNPQCETFIYKGLTGMIKNIGAQCTSTRKKLTLKIEAITKTPFRCP